MIKHDILEKLKKQIDYESLPLPWYNLELVDVMLDYMSEVIAYRQNIRMSGVEYDWQTLKAAFDKLTQEDIVFAVECINNNTTQIKDIKKYYLMTLYNAHNNMVAAINSQVKHDMAYFPPPPEWE